MSKVINGFLFHFWTSVGAFYCRVKGVNMSTNVLVNKPPLILKHKNAEIILANGVSINSNNNGYHLNMYSRCKLYADLAESKIIIGANTRIHGTCIHAQSQINIGQNCLIAANTNIIDSNGHLLSFDYPENRINTRDIPKPISIGDNVWIGANSMVLGGVNIGNGSVIAAHSVVKNDIPSMCLAAGNPAVVIKKINKV